MGLPVLKFSKLFLRRKCSLVGMIHADPLPGTPLFRGSVDKIVTKACKEAEIYLKNEVDGILLENMNDVPYVQSKYFTPETVSVMTRISAELRHIIPCEIPFGVQVLAGGNKEALAIAKACSLNFIRAEGYVFSHIADEGFTDANAGTTLRYRRMIDAEDVLVFADIKKKHSSHSITSDISLEETARAAEMFLADGVILTGSSTGDPANEKELTLLKKATSLPILIGSGVTAANVDKYKEADALIIGSYFKKDGNWQNDVDEERVINFMKKIKDLDF